MSKLSNKQNAAKIVQDVLKIDLNKITKSKRQQYLLSKMFSTNMDEFTAYAASLLGVKTQRYNLTTLDSIRYVQSKVKRNPVSDKYLEIYNDIKKTNTSHGPISPANHQDKQWTGVEIECYVNFRKLSEMYFKMFGEYITIYDDNAESERECEVCGGSGDIYNDETEEYDECSECDGRGSFHNYGGDTSIVEYISENSYDFDEDKWEDVRKIFQTALGRVVQKMGITRTSVKNDGSLSDKYNEKYFAVEICHIFTMKNQDKLKMLCDLLSKLGARVDRKCGLHVHLDCRDILEQGYNLGKSRENSVRKQRTNFDRVIPALSKLVPKSRRDNDYCQLQSSSTDRYSAVNLCSLAEHQTIEIRLHSGTTDFTKIINWCRLNWLILNADNTIVGSCHSLMELDSMLNLPSDLKQYFSARELLFGPKNVSGSTRSLIVESQYRDNDDLTSNQQAAGF